MHETRLRLRDGLHFCRLDGVFVFLDLENDTYFRLSDSLGQIFIAYLSNDGGDDGIHRLVRQGILVDGQTTAELSPILTSPPPCRSAVEQALIHDDLTILDILDVFSVTISTLARLEACTLQEVLRSLCKYRQSASSRALPLPGGSTNKSSAKAATAFLRARVYVPIETRCLLDSLAMVRFLAKRGHRASVVFGVTSDPFSAHCWVQDGDLLLNDSIGNIETYTPIWTF
jgi:hypothetical protein